MCLGVYMCLRVGTGGYGWVRVGKGGYSRVWVCVGVHVSVTARGLLCCCLYSTARSGGGGGEALPGSVMDPWVKGGWKWVGVGGGGTTRGVCWVGVGVGGGGSTVRCVYARHMYVRHACAREVPASTVWQCDLCGLWSVVCGCCVVGQGGVVIVMTIYDTKFCFVSSHLAAHLKHLDARNSNVGGAGRAGQGRAEAVWGAPITEVSV
jgi:hypothetical protein